MSTELHIRNIERELEVIKNCLFDLVTQDAMFARDNGQLALADKFLRLREELDSIYPKPKIACDHCQRIFDRSEISEHMRTHV